MAYGTYGIHRIWKIWCAKCKHLPFQFTPSKMESDRITWLGCKACNGPLETEHLHINATGRGVSEALTRAVRESMGLAD
jgi:hypothetical protein